MCQSNGKRNGNGNGNGGEHLTAKQRAFVDQWFVCQFNGTEAAKQAGYQGNRATLATAAYRLLRKDKIKRAIEERWESHGVTQAEVISRFAGWMRFDIAQLLDAHGNIDFQKVREYGGMIKSIERDGTDYKIIIMDQMKAAENIAKTLGMFREKIEQEHSGEVIVRFAKPEEFPE